jgi:serine/threonine protein kinase
VLLNQFITGLDLSQFSVDAVPDHVFVPLLLNVLSRRPNYAYVHDYMYIFDAWDAAGGHDSPAKKRSNNLAAGLAYLHGESVVHDDVKARNVLIGADDRAKLGDFGCANKSSAGTGEKMIGDTPAFMAPEVARGEEQGPAADVWALGCTVVEMATGRAPWTSMDGDALAAMHRIAYTDAVSEVPQWLSAEAKDFLGMCLVRWSSERCTAAQLLEHPFLASTRCEEKLEEVKR